MKKIFLTLLMLFWSLPLLANDAAIEFMDKLSQDVITNGIQGTKTISERETFMHQRFTTNLDLKSIGQFVLGTYWKKVSTEDKEAFLTAFTDLLTKTWTDRFGMYNGQKITFQGTRPAGQKNQLYVDSEITDKTPISLIWRLREKNGSFLLVDIIVEDVSMAMTYRSEYTAFLQQHQGNLKELTAELRNKVENFKYNDKK